MNEDEITQLADALYQATSQSNGEHTPYIGPEEAQWLARWLAGRLQQAIEQADECAKSSDNISFQSIAWKLHGLGEPDEDTRGV